MKSERDYGEYDGKRLGCLSPHLEQKVQATVRFEHFASQRQTYEDNEKEKVEEERDEALSHTRPRTTEPGYYQPPVNEQLAGLREQIGIVQGQYFAAQDASEKKKYQETLDDLTAECLVFEDLQVPTVE